MTDLANWLLACIADDEDRDRRIVKLARAMYAAFQPNNPYTFDEQAVDVRVEYQHAAGVIVDRDMPIVLAECDAKRQIVADHSSPHTVGDGWCVEEGGKCTHVGEDRCDRCGQEPCRTLRLLALPLSVRPGYREEWRP